jgi:hypothetical protein
MTTAVDRPKRIPPRVREAIAAMVGGECKTVTAAAEKVGLSREYLSRQLSVPHITEFMQNKVRRRLNVAAARAGSTKIDLLDCDSLHVRNDASSYILGLAGITPLSTPSVSFNVNIRAGYVIDLSEPDDAPVTIEAQANR